MHLTLKLHPDSSCAAVANIAVEVARRADALTFDYSVAGRIADLALGAPTPPARADELWRTTCFEAFLKAGQGEGYFELNFAPSSQWQAYAFTATRAGMRVADEIAAPRIETHAAADRYNLRASIVLPASLRDASLRIGLSAVIEEASGAKSYWALAHPPGKPDFHHPDAFVLTIPAA